MNKYILTGSGVTVIFNGKPLSVNADHDNYDEILAAIITGESEDTIMELMSPKVRIQSLVWNHSSPELEFDDENESLTFIQADGTRRDLPSDLAVDMIKIANVAGNIEPYINFCRNMFDNPSYRAVTELYGFLKSAGLVLTPEGNFLAYKMVRADYTDQHSGKFDNSVGQVVKMPRNMVNEDKNQTCSAGLHFAAYNYASTFGSGHLMVIEINPKDVVSIPTDYNNEKGRCCEYKVVEEVTDEKYANTSYTAEHSPMTPEEEELPADYRDYDDDEDWEDDEIDEDWHDDQDDDDDADEPDVVNMAPFKNHGNCRKCVYASIPTQIYPCSNCIRFDPYSGTNVTHNFIAK